jgi:hypothetical protein
MTVAVFIIFYTISSMAKSHLVLIASALIGFSSCASMDFCGPCHRAALLRKDAEKAQGLKKAELLGKADAAQAECDRNVKVIDEHKKLELEKKK